jgi:hypothetical protein
MPCPYRQRIEVERARKVALCVGFDKGVDWMSWRVDNHVAGYQSNSVNRCKNLSNKRLVTLYHKTSFVIFIFFNQYHH